MIIVSFRNCERGAAIYTTFKLKNKFDLSEIDYKNWKDLNDVLRKLNIGPLMYKLLPDEVSNELNVLNVKLTNVNFTYLRDIASGKSLTDQDLNGFLKQIELVTKQISDSNTVKALNKIYASVENIIMNELRDLIKKRDNVLYELMSLEILLKPFRNSTNKLQIKMNNIKDNLIKYESEIILQVCMN